MNPKVYVIKPSDPNDRGIPSDNSALPALPSNGSRSGAAKGHPRVDVPPATIRDRWARVLRAYLLGPIALVLWPTGRLRIPWAVLGAGSVIAVILLLLSWSSFAGGLQTTSNGVLLWIATVSMVILITATAWSRAVAITGRDHPTLASISSRRLRHPRTVGALGMIFPGFGLLMAGRFRRAACLLWIVGPLVAAVVILANWRWLWARSQSPVPPGVSGTTLEIVFIAAAGVAILLFFTLIVQALDGARRFSPVTRSRALADAVGVALVVALALFTTTFQPVAFGQSLGAVSIALHRDGFRLIPLGLCEAAARLDPATPAHLANAAVINEELGMRDAAHAKRQIIERRMKEYVDIVRYNKRAGEMSLVFSSVADNPLDAMAQTPAGETWTRIRGLLRSRGHQSPPSGR